MYIILVYDIKDVENNQKVWRRTFKTCKKYLQHVQKSVFEGEIKLSQYRQLKYELEEILRCNHDSCIVYQFNNSKPDQKELLGMQIDVTDIFI